ncbi:MAG: CRISPR-associated endonuclease Cas1 [Burkholderiaceae bacterium]
MSTLVLDKPQLELRSDGTALALYEDGERRGTVPLGLLERVVLLGSQIRLDSGVLARLGEAGVAVLVLGRRGGQRLSLALGPRHNDAALRLAQCSAAMEGHTALAYARALIRAKLCAQRRALQDMLAVRADCRKPLTDALASLREVEASVDAADTVDVLRGCEGAAAAAHFRALTAVFPPALGFAGRNRRPPRDPVNAGLSLGYTLLHLDAVRACHVAGLDPLIGFYHRPAFGRESLACDLIEPLRPRLDQWLWNLFRSRTLREDHFATSASGCQLQKAGRARFYAEYEQAARPWRRWLRSRCAALARQLRDRAAPLLDDGDTIDLP